jgi:hypothetical protein
MSLKNGTADVMLPVTGKADHVTGKPGDGVKDAGAIMPHVACLSLLTAVCTLHFVIRRDEKDEHCTLSLLH